MLNNYLNWQGNRNNLFDVLLEIEKKFPKKYKMLSKKNGSFLEIKMTRIQQFLNLKILPKSIPLDKGFGYSNEHIFRYLAAIVLYNNGQSLKQISELLNSYNIEEIKDLFISDEAFFSKDVKPKIISEKFSQSKLSQELKKLGREEGRVLRSQWMKFAITKWCVVEVQKKQLSKLTDEDVDIITKAFKLSLLQTKKLSDLDKSIS